LHRFARAAGLPNVTDRQTDASTIAKTREALHALARKMWTQISGWLKATQSTDKQCAFW